MVARGTRDDGMPVQPCSCTGFSRARNCRLVVPRMRLPGAQAQPRSLPSSQVSQHEPDEMQVH
jgi:hypothetical protein